MLLKWIPVLALSAVVAACGGGGDGGLGTDGTDSAASETGFFIDSRVSGLTWVTQFNGQNTGIGTTSFNGAFPYLQGETVTFRIGDLELGTVQASAYITPLTLAGTTNTTNIRHQFNDRIFTVEGIQTELMSSFATGDLRHELTAGVRVHEESVIGRDHHLMEAALLEQVVHHAQLA